MKQQKLKICGGGLNTGQSPHHPPSKKVSTLDCSREGLEELEKGSHCSSRVKGFLGSKAPRIALLQHTPDQHIPLNDSLTPLVACPKVGTFGCLDH